MLADAFIKQLVELRGLLEVCDVFMERSFIRTSLLFVYSSVTNETQVRQQQQPHRREWLAPLGVSRRISAHLGASRRICAQLAMIDFPKVTKRKTRLTHRDAWTPVRVLLLQRGWPSVVWLARPNRAAPITQRSCLNPTAG